MFILNKIISVQTNLLDKRKSLDSYQVSLAVKELEAVNLEKLSAFFETSLKKSGAIKITLKHFELLNHSELFDNEERSFLYKKLKAAYVLAYLSNNYRFDNEHIKFSFMPDLQPNIKAYSICDGLFIEYHGTKLELEAIKPELMRKIDILGNEAKEIDQMIKDIEREIDYKSKVIKV